MSEKMKQRAFIAAIVVVVGLSAIILVKDLIDVFQNADMSEVLPPAASQIEEVVEEVEKLDSDEPLPDDSNKYAVKQEKAAKITDNGKFVAIKDNDTILIDLSSDKNDESGTEIKLAGIRTSDKTAEKLKEKLKAGDFLLIEYTEDKNTAYLYMPDYTCLQDILVDESAAEKQ